MKRTRQIRRLTPLRDNPDSTNQKLLESFMETEDEAPASYSVKEHRHVDYKGKEFTSITLHAETAPEKKERRPYKMTDAQFRVWFEDMLDEVAYDVIDIGPCKIWQGDLRPRGKYGQLWYKGAMRGAHVVAWMLAHPNDPAPEKGMDVSHWCNDRPACCNPDHLFLVPHEDNIKDASAKQRMMHGEEHYRAILTNEKVRIIKGLLTLGKLSQRQIAQVMDVKPARVSAINNGAWKHVGAEPDQNYLLRLIKEQEDSE